MEFICIKLKKKKNEKIILSIILLLFFFLSFSQDWKYNFRRNQKNSFGGKKKKKIIIVFLVLDWCAPCIKLDKNILAIWKFFKEASKRMDNCKIDFPSKNANTLSKEQTRAQQNVS